MEGVEFVKKWLVERGFEKYCGAFEGKSQYKYKRNRASCFILAVDHVVATIILAHELSLNFSVREIVNMFCQKYLIISSKDTIKAAMKIMRAA